MNTEEKVVLDPQMIQQLMPYRYPFLLVDKILKIENRQFIIGIKNVSVNEPFFQGHFPSHPVMPGVLILEALAQTGSILMMKDSEFSSRLAFFASLDKVKFRKPVVPGDQLRLEMDVAKVRQNYVQMKGVALVDGRVVCEGNFLFTLVEKPSRPQIHPTAFVHHTALLGKDVVVGPNTIIGENVIIGDRTILESHILIEKWTKIGKENHIHTGSVIGSAAQDVKYKGEKSWVVIGDRNMIREYVTINRATGEGMITEIGSDNIFLTHVHIAHNCMIGSNVVIVNMTNIAGHTHIEDRAIVGGMTGVHQFCRIGKGAMIGAYTRLPQDVPPYMLCEGNPAVIHGLNSVGLRRSGASRAAIQEIKNIYKLFYRSGLNASQAEESLKSMPIGTDEAQHLVTFLLGKSKRGITRKSSDAEKEEGSIEV